MPTIRDPAPTEPMALLSALPEPDRAAFACLHAAVTSDWGPRDAYERRWVMELVTSCGARTGCAAGAGDAGRGRGRRARPRDATVRKLDTFARYGARIDKDMAKALQALRTLRNRPDAWIDEVQNGTSEPGEAGAHQQNRTNGFRRARANPSDRPTAVACTPEPGRAAEPAAAPGAGGGAAQTGRLTPLSRSPAGRMLRPALHQGGVPHGAPVPGSRHAGAACRAGARPRDRRAGGADPPDDLLRIRGYRPRGGPVQPGARRAPLQPDLQPDRGRARGAGRGAGGRGRGRRHGQRAGGAAPRHRHADGCRRRTSWRRATSMAAASTCCA